MTFMIPYASGTPVSLTTITGGLAGTYATLGFGSHAASSTVLDTTLDLASTGGGMANTSYVTPNSITYESITAVFSTVGNLNLIATDVTIFAAMYSAPIDSNTYTQVAGSKVMLEPSLSGIVAPGTIVSGHLGGIASEGSIIEGQHKVVIAVWAEAEGLILVNSLSGYASASVCVYPM